MRCSNQGCKITKHINPSNLLCPHCEKEMNKAQRRLTVNERQSMARTQAQDKSRDLNVSFSSDVSPPVMSAAMGISPSIDNLMASNALNIAPPAAIQTPSDLSMAASSSVPPPLNLSSLQSSYSEILTKGWDPKHFSAMFGMLLQVVSKQQDMDSVCLTVQSNTERIRELENKVGGSDEISEKFGLLIRNLPLPPSGKSDLDQVRDALSHIFPHDIRSDITKAKRIGQTQSYVGVVKVEVKNEEVRTAIMTNKKVLNNHPNELIRSLQISNLKPNNQMFSENVARDILKMIPGGDQVYITRSGRLRQKEVETTFGNRRSQQSYQASNVAPSQTPCNINLPPPRVPMPTTSVQNGSHAFQGSQVCQQQSYLPITNPQQAHFNGHSTNSHSVATNQIPEVSLLSNQVQYNNAGQSFGAFEPVNSAQPNSSNVPNLISNDFSNAAPPQFHQTSSGVLFSEVQNQEGAFFSANGAD